jgi:hypothetical protein
MMKMSATFLCLTLLSLQTVESQYYSVDTGYVQKYATHLPFIPVYGGSPRLFMYEPSVPKVPTYLPEDVYEYTNDLDDIPSDDVPNNSPEVINTDEGDSDFKDTSLDDNTNNDDGDHIVFPPPSPPSNENESKQLTPTIIVMVTLGLIGYCMIFM